MQHPQRETGRLIRWIRRQELLITAVLCCVHAFLSLWRVGERVLWLIRDFKPLRIPYENELMIAHEGWILLTALLAVWTAAGCMRLYLHSGRPRVGMLRGAALAQKWLARLLSLAVLVTFVMISCVAWDYRVSVTTLGTIVLTGAAVLFCCVTRVRFWRNIARILKDARRRSDNGVKGCLRFQSIIVLLTGLLPVIAVWMEGELITALTGVVSSVIPLATEEAMRDLIRRTGGMYMTDLGRTLTGALAGGMVYFLYGSYRASYGNTLTGRLRCKNPDRPDGWKPKTPPPERDPGRRPWGKGL